MKKKLIIVLLFSISGFSLPAQGLTFNKTYHIGTDNLFNVIEIDSGYLSVISPGYPFYPKKMAVTKFDLNGNITVQNIYGDTFDYHTNYSLIHTYDNNFISGASNSNSNTQEKSIFFMKVNINCDTIWSKSLHPTSGYEFYGIYLMETKDKGLLITGQVADSLNLDGDALIIKTDSLGNEQWRRIYGGALFDGFYSSVQLADDSYLSLGWTRSFGFGSNTNRDVYLVKTDSAGNFLWQKTYGTITFESGIGITALSDGNFALACFEEVGSGGDGTIYKIDSAGNVIWHKAYTPAQLTEFWWVRERSDNTLIAVGAVTPSQGANDRGILVKADSAGNFLWKRDFPLGNSHAYFRDVQCTSDGGYIAAGFCFQGASGGQDAWIVKLDSLGCDSAGCPTITAITNPIPVAINDIKLFPNPAKEKITLSFSRSLFTAARIKIYDIMGKQVFQQPAFIQKQISIPVYQLPQGVYVIEVNHEGLKERIKFVKE